MSEVESEVALKSHAQSLPKLGAIDSLTAIAKSTAKRGIDAYFASKVALLRAIGVVDFPVPPNSRLRRTSSHTIRHYYESGLTTMMPILTAARLYGVDLDQPVKVLDFGCGVARQLLQLTRNYPNLQAYGCDIAPDNIKHIKRAFPKVGAYVNNFDPPLMYPDGAFGLVYSVSTFSHFSTDDAKLWLTEFRRITKPGGLLCLTFNGNTSLELAHRRGLHLDYTAEQLEKDGYFFEVDEDRWRKGKAADAITAFGSGTLCETRPTGHIYYSQKYASRLVESVGLEFLAIAPGCIDRMQDLAVLRRPMA